MSDVEDDVVRFIGQSEPMQLCLSALDRLEALPDGRSNDALADLRTALRACAGRDRVIEALYRTASDITSEQSVDDVIAAAVKRAHLLIGCDLAYLSLFDTSTRETCVKAVSGARSDKFVELRVPYGLGVGGVVARSMAPFQTDDYLSERNFGHIARVDKGMELEDIRAVAGAPMMVGAEFVGAMFIANRNTHIFTGDEISQLVALSAFVALAVSNARMHEAREQSLRDAKNAYAVLEKRNELIARIAKLHEKVLEAVTEGATVTALANIVSSALGMRVTYVAQQETGPFLETSLVDKGISDATMHREFLKALQTSKRLGTVQRVNVAGGTEFWTVALANGDALYGAFLINCTVSPLGIEQRSLERAAHAAALLLVRARDELLQVSRRWSRAFQALMSDDVAGQRSTSNFAADMFNDADPVTMFCFRPMPLDFDSFLIKAVAFAIEAKCMVAEYSERIFVLIQGADVQVDKVFRRLSYFGKAGMNAGIAVSSNAAPELRSAINDAILAQLHLDQRGQSGAATRLDELGTMLLLLKGKEQSELKVTVERVIGEVVRYDQKNSTALLDSLEAYFDAGCNASSAAVQLGVHHRTMVQRLERLNSLLGENWKNGSKRLDLEVALRIYRLLTPTRR